MVAFLGLLVTYLVAPLNGNLRYEAGVKVVGTDSAAATFSHRPLAFRILMNGIFRLADGMSVGTASFELAVRLIVAALAVGAGAVLWVGLRRYGVRNPALHAVVAVGAILLVGPVNTGEPDWMAVVLTLAAVGVALRGPRHPWGWAVLAGVLFVGAAGMKIVTLPTALLGLMVVTVLDRRQDLRAVVASFVIGCLYVLVILLWVPWEVQWLLDIRTVQKDAIAALPDAWPFFADQAARRPALALVPAALVLARPRERLLTGLALAVGVALVVVQGQYFGYHTAPLVVVAALAVFRSFRSKVSTTAGIAIVTVVVAAIASTLIDPGWVLDHERVRGGALLAVSAAAAGWAVVVRTRPAVGGRSGPLVAALVGLALVCPGSTPWAARMLRLENPNGTRPTSTLEWRAEQEATARQVHEVVGGPDVPVTYLTFGEWTYFVGNPTDCRYPSPLFLQRSAIRSLRGATRSPSYRENLACLSAPGSRWLVWDPSWFGLLRTPAEVQTTVEREWNCADAVDVGALRLCPRRA